MSTDHKIPDGWPQHVRLRQETDERHEVLSTREYHVYETTAEQQPDDEMYGDDKPVLAKLMLYVDRETGLVTGDVEAFEGWLARNNFLK